METLWFRNWQKAVASSLFRMGYNGVSIELVLFSRPFLVGVVCPSSELDTRSRWEPCSRAPSGFWLPWRKGAGERSAPSVLPREQHFPGGGVPRRGSSAEDFEERSFRTSSLLRTCASTWDGYDSHSDTDKTSARRHSFDNIYEIRMIGSIKEYD